MSRSLKLARPSTPVERGWFIYYQVMLADLPDIATAVRSGQRELASRYPGIATEFLRRPADIGVAGSPMVTVMEIYRAPGGWPVETQAQVPGVIEALVGRQVAGWIQGPRHLEVFEPCA